MIVAALRRELTPDQRNELAREPTGELLGDRPPYTLTAHKSVALDNAEQPNMHLMFRTRPVNDQTRSIEKGTVFKRNGAKKDRDWQNRDKPKEIRDKRVELLNAAMERAGHEQRFDTRSYEAQGRSDLVELREPKLREDNNRIEMVKLRSNVDGLRRKRAALPTTGLNAKEAIAQIEREAEKEIAEVEQRVRTRPR